MSYSNNNNVVSVSIPPPTLLQNKPDTHVRWPSNCCSTSLLPVSFSSVSCSPIVPQGTTFFTAVMGYRKRTQLRFHSLELLFLDILAMSRGLKKIFVGLTCTPHPLSPNVCTHCTHVLWLRTVRVRVSLVCMQQIFFTVSTTQV